MMSKIAMAVTMVALAAAPLTAQQGQHHQQGEQPHQCPHHQGEHQGGEHAMGQHEMGQHQMGEGHAGMQEMHQVMMMMHHPEELELSEAQVEQLGALMDRAHADGMPRMQGPEVMSAVVEEARGILTAEQRDRLAEMQMEHPMGEGCPMMKDGEAGGHGGHGQHGAAGGHGHH